MKKVVEQHPRVLLRKPVAFNSNPHWPKEYFAVLAEAGIPDREHAFDTQWVRQFFNRNCLVPQCSGTN
ncbi:MAG: hypothetical protein WC959_06190 [Kiritimatiellales bacterium]